MQSICVVSYLVEAKSNLFKAILPNRENRHYQIDLHSTQVFFKNFLWGDIPMHPKNSIQSLHAQYCA